MVTTGTGGPGGARLRPRRRRPERGPGAHARGGGAVGRRRRRCPHRRRPLAGAASDDDGEPILELGEVDEDILAGLHRAIILRAMSLLARSGGVADEFTFTGGVARNEAAVAALTQLVRENYGDVQINISPDSIYTGALGTWRHYEKHLDLWKEELADIIAALPEQVRNAGLK